MGLGADRRFASVPTLDTERKTPFNLSRDWSPSNIDIFGHSINIDLPTGNLLISTTDVAYPYYNFFLGITREYDLQEQHMQLTYLRNYPNVNPKPHWFGNWQFTYEADVDEVWHESFAELHVTSGVGANCLFERDHPDFKRNLKEESEVENFLLTYGIPRQTLSALGWTFTGNDLLFRTKRGIFQIITGHFHAETLVDDIEAKIWVFNPITGSAFHITSEYFFNESSDQFRDVGIPLLVSKKVDALGHSMTLQPVSGGPPYKEFALSDGSTLPDGTNRRFILKLETELTFLDGLKLGRKVRKNLVKEVIDATKPDNNLFTYAYTFHNYEPALQPNGTTGFPLLKRIVFPCSITGKNREITYHYDDPDYPGALTEIENSDGDSIQFIYQEDLLDFDERLNPRLKIHKIIDPEGVTFEYDYNYNNDEVVVKIYLDEDNPDREITYRYIRDLRNTKQRYIVSTKTEVTRGYSGNQPIIHSTIYTTDGRFNVKKTIDPLHDEPDGEGGKFERFQEFEYNSFNQVKKSTDFDGKLTENDYDPPANPSPETPYHYDVREEKRENRIRTVDTTTNAITENVATITRVFTYVPYGATEPQSTHRVHTETDERGKVWTYTYANFDTHNNHNPLTPTIITSPPLITSSGLVSFETKAKYNDRGERVAVIDAEGNLHEYQYTAQGQLEKYTDPNKGCIDLEYYACGNWLKKFKDQLYSTHNKFTEFERFSDGKIEKITDPEGDNVSFNYLKNDRLEKVIKYCPATPFHPDKPEIKTRNYTNLVTILSYTPLGALHTLTNPKGLVLQLDYDEVGRVIHWFHSPMPDKKTEYKYDKAGQIRVITDKAGNQTIFSYTNMGFVKVIQYPDWNEGASKGKRVEYQSYDYFGRVFTVREIDGDLTAPTLVRELAYDPAGNVTFRHDRYAPNDEIFLHFVYDDANRLTHAKDFSEKYLLGLGIDCLDRPESLTDAALTAAGWDDAITWTYKYQRPTAPHDVLNLYEIAATTLKLKTTLDYDKKNRLTEFAHEWTDPPLPAFKRTFIYRTDDLLEEITGSDLNTYCYDSIKQLIYEGQGELIWDYDPAGNRLFQIPLAPFVDLTAAQQQTIKNGVESNINIINQLRKINAWDPTVGTAGTVTAAAELYYGLNRNLKKIENVSPPADDEIFIFDGMNKLRIYKKGTFELKYKYNVDGNLIERVHPTEGTTRFYYLFSKPIILKRDDELFLIATWDPNGQLLRIRSNQMIGGASFPHSLFPLYDGQGNILRLVDCDRNDQVEISYDAWGESEIKINDPSINYNFWGYQGGILDKETGLILFGARWYSPKLGRWISEDPVVGTSTSFENENYRVLSNLYTYCINDPVNLVDPSGYFVGVLAAVAALVIASLLLMDIFYDPDPFEKPGDVFEIENWTGWPVKHEEYVGPPWEKSGWFLGIPPQEWMSDPSGGHETGHKHEYKHGHEHVEPEPLKWGRLERPIKDPIMRKKKRRRIMGIKRQQRQKLK